MASELAPDISGVQRRRQRRVDKDDRETNQICAAETRNLQKRRVAVLGYRQIIPRQRPRPAPLQHQISGRHRDAKHQFAPPRVTRRIGDPVAERSQPVIAVQPQIAVKRPDRQREHSEIKRKHRSQNIRNRTKGALYFPQKIKRGEAPRPAERHAEKKHRNFWQMTA